MAGALEGVRTWTDGGIGTAERRLSPHPPEIDVRALLKTLPEPELPAGLEDRLRAFLQGRRGYVGH